MSVVIALVDSNYNGQSQHVETKVNDKAIRTVCKWQEAKCEQLEVLVSWVYGTIVKKGKPVAVRIKTKSKPLWIAFDIQFKTTLVIYSSLLCSIVFTVLSFGIPCHTVLSSSLHCMDYFAFSSEISMFQYKPWWSYSTFKYINVTLCHSLRYSVQWTFWRLHWMFLLANLPVHVLNTKHWIWWLLQSVEVCALCPLELSPYKFPSLSIVLGLET